MALEGMLVQTLGPTKTYSSSPVQHVDLINDLFVHFGHNHFSKTNKQTSISKPVLRTRAKHAQSTEDL